MIANAVNHLDVLALAELTEELLTRLCDACHGTRPDRVAILGTLLSDAATALHAAGLTLQGHQNPDDFD